MQTRRRIEVRMRRQAVVERPDGPMLWVVLDEAALRRPIGDPSVMKCQIIHLLKQAARPNVTIQLLPYSVGAHAAQGGAFTIMHFRADELRDVVYVEHLAGAQYIEQPDDVERYSRAMDHISAEAMSSEETIALLESLAESTGRYPHDWP
jgi:hypothetical protein